MVASPDPVVDERLVGANIFYIINTSENVEQLSDVGYCKPLVGSSFNLLLIAPVMSLSWLLVRYTVE